MPTGIIIALVMFLVGTIVMFVGFRQPGGAASSLMILGGAFAIIGLIVFVVTIFYEFWIQSFDCPSCVLGQTTSED